MPKKGQKIVVILPAYNEGSVIGKVLDNLPKNIKIKNKVYPLSVVVINDSSTDNTVQVVSKRKNVQLINHLFNGGAGAATRTGLTYAKQIDCAFCVTMDADGQHKAADFTRLVKAIVAGNADLIVGSRLIRARGMPSYRIIGNKFLSFITFLLFGIFVTDSQSGLKALNRVALEKILFHSNSFAFSSEILWRARQQKLRVSEIPVTPVYTKYSLAKGQRNVNVIYLFGELLKRRLLDIVNG